jgi:ATPase subunit of ABC transporter with duplicated ATPase domains
MISASNLEMSYGDRILFSGAALQLNSGERYGLVGANGSGKTTLLNVLAGDIQPTDGTVQLPKGCRLGVLRQDQFVQDDEEILGVALMGNRELWEAMVEKEALLARGEDDFDVDRFGELEETVQRHDGYAAEAKAAVILEGLGLPTEVHRNRLSTLSGGFKLRVLLAQVLASAPDVLLLDEPTNHLDILSIRWLEKFLETFSGPAVIISHDHRFLDNVATRILDVDYGTVIAYRGNYTSFLGQKVSERNRREKEIGLREREIAQHQDFVDRFRAKASKARQAQSKLRFIEKKANELDALPGSSRRYPRFRFEQRRPSGRDVLEIDGVWKSYGDNTVLHGVDLSIRRGDRVAIMGPNGIGKSTLLKILVGRLEAEKGSAKWGYETHPGYFAQDIREELEGSAKSGKNETIEDWLWGFCPGKDRGFVRGQLGMMLFSGDDGEKRLSSLSGGEAARLAFARLALEQPNVLILDEPTNHLDLEAIEALVEGLNRFEGTLILVSHDRWFVSRLATRIVEIQPEGITDYLGTYEEYVHFSGDDHLDADRVVLKAKREKRKERKAAKAAPAKTSEPRPRDTARKRKELEGQRDQLLASLETAERRVAEIDATFGQPGYYEKTDAEAVTALDGERVALTQEIERVTGAWEDIERGLEAIAK